MITTRFVKMALSGFVATIALTGGHSGPASRAEMPSDSQAAQLAAIAATKASSALAAHDYRSAIDAAETAVGYAPRDAGYRLILAQAYLGGGRFASAETGFADVLTLSPDNARAALNLALVQIARGKNDAALVTLGDYREKLAAPDYALAAALAGDVETAVVTLETAIRAGSNDAKTRQNLALAYAMAGKWANARAMAQQDLSGADTDTRLGEWLTFVRPGSSYDQVASLLGVKPMLSDTGQPQRLALNAGSVTAVAMAEPLAAPAPVAAPAPEPVFETVEVAAPAPEPVFETAEVAAPAPVQAAPVRREIVQPLPVRAPAPVETIRAAALPAKQMVVPRAKPAPSIAAAVQPKPARSVAAGKFVVQLGAFQNAAVSRDAWRRMAPRYRLSAFDPANSSARVGGASYVRLAVGGFATRAEASLVCSRIRSAGGSCFVRGRLGDAPAQWVMRGLPKAARPVRMASR